MKIAAPPVFYLLLVTPLDAHARGDGSFLLVVLLIVLVPVLLYLLQIWTLLALTIVPILFGFYYLISAKSLVVAILGLILIAVGSAFTWFVATTEQKEKFRNFFR